jgi:small subunit ribosomal protein S5e
MSDSGDVEVETVQGYQVLPKEVTEEIGSIKLFNKWYALHQRRGVQVQLKRVADRKCYRSYEDVEIRDISLT